MAGVYIHIPFCTSKCRYCDFYSVTRLELRASFIQAVREELRLRAYELEGEEVQTIYFGGGTPSLIPAEDIRAILKLIAECYRVSPTAEVTMECNPGDLSMMELQTLLQSGINRFSIGAQSFDRATLSFLNRRHQPEETLRMYDYLRSLGVPNISLDLMYGIPNTNMDKLQRDIDQIIRLRPEHISTYHLIYEEGTPLYRDLQVGKISEVDEVLSLQMSHVISRKLVEAGYEHYEISNYALPGYQSRHNSSYWTGTPYIGVGPSAHSYLHPWRSENPPHLHHYLDALLRPTSPFLVRSFEYINLQLAYEEYILTHLRISRGILLEEIKERFGIQCFQKAELQVRSLVSRELMYLNNHGCYALTTRGIDLSDAIMASFF